MTKPKTYKLNAGAVSRFLVSKLFTRSTSYAAPTRGVRNRCGGFEVVSIPGCNDFLQVICVRSWSAMGDGVEMRRRQCRAYHEVLSERFDSTYTETKMGAHVTLRPKTHAPPLGDSTEVSDE